MKGEFDGRTHFKTCMCFIPYYVQIRKNLFSVAIDIVT